ncbi:MAG: CRTAC1 family protein [Cyanobacteria bacterium P01_H01_bin.15]
MTYLDVFITRGANRGQLSAQSGQNDELFVSEGPVLRNLASEQGIEKSACPGRHTRLTDFNQDDLIDIYVTCGRERPPNKNYPNQLYVQQSRGQFKDLASDLSVDLGTQGPVIWADLNGDRLPDLIQATGESVQILRHQTSGAATAETPFVKTELPLSADSAIQQILAADFDRDGDQDLFCVSSTESLLGLNDGDRIDIQPAEQWGLPATSVSANWLDLDQDGTLEFYSFPAGLYRQTQSGQFQGSPLLRSNQSWSGMTGFSNWFDADNDGDLDLLITHSQRLSLWQRIYRRFWSGEHAVLGRPGQFLLYLNDSAAKSNHWLSLDLVGLPGNQQALNATVKAETDGMMQQLPVGFAEASHHSQGHYRLYFGLGPSTQVKALTVTWSNGKVSQLTGIDSDQHLTIHQDAG